jgi:tetratricopeptide (TPR) repeat protein
MANGVSEDGHSTRPNAVHGPVDSTIVQAGVVHGGLHLAVPNRDIVPRQLIPPPARFTDRRPEQEFLTRAWQARSGPAPTVVILKGPGGVGKTALALHWLGERLAEFPDGQLHADLAEPNGEPVDPDDVLGRYLRALGVAPQLVPTGLAERTALFRSVTAGRALAVLLDNAMSAAQAKVLLPASARSVVLVTSRRPLFGLLAEGARVLPVEPLATADAVDLLAGRVGVERVRAEHEPATALARLCGGLPIALCVAAALTLARPRRSLASTANELRAEQHRLSVLSVDAELSVRGAFDMSYLDISEPARRAYKVMGLHPGEEFSDGLFLAAVGARAPLDELVDASLIEELDTGYYRFHDLIRVHARERAATDPEAEQEAAIRRMAEWYLRAALAANAAVLPARRQLAYEFPATAPAVPAGLDNYDHALAWLERSRRAMGALVRLAAERGWAGLTHQLADALQPLFILHKHYADAVATGEIAVSVALADGDAEAEVNMRKRLARTYSLLGEFDRAAQHITAMLATTRATGDRRGEASALKSRALLLTRSGRPEAAVDLLRQTLAMLAELDLTYDQGLTLINLGDVLLTLGRFAEAIGELESALPLLSAPARTDRYNATRAAIRLGQAHLGAGHLATARALLTDAVATMTELDSAVERATAEAALAELARRAGPT